MRKRYNRFKALMDAEVDVLIVFTGELKTIRHAFSLIDCELVTIRGDIKKIKGGTPDHPNYRLRVLCSVANVPILKHLVDEQTSDEEWLKNIRKGFRSIEF